MNSDTEQRDAMVEAARVAFLCGAFVYAECSHGRWGRVTAIRHHKGVVTLRGHVINESDVPWQTQSPTVVKIVRSK